MSGKHGRVSRGLRTAALGALVLAVGSGCTPLATRYRTLDATPSPYVGPARFPYRDLPADAPLEQELGPGAPAYAFPQGKSYFLPLRLAEGDAPRRLLLRSRPAGYYRRPILFCATATFYGTDFAPLETVFRVPRDVSSYLGWFVSGGLFETVYDVPPEAAYVALHADPGNAEAGVTERWPLSRWVGGSWEMLVLSALLPNEYRVLTCAPTGRLTVAASEAALAGPLLPADGPE